MSKKYFQGLVLMMIVFLFCSQLSYSEKVKGKKGSIEREVALIAQNLLTQTTLKGKKIAVGEFTDTNKRVSSLSTLLAENL